MVKKSRRVKELVLVIIGFTGFSLRKNTQYSSSSTPMESKLANIWVTFHLALCMMKGDKQERGRKYRKRPRKGINEIMTRW